MHSIALIKRTPSSNLHEAMLTALIQCAQTSNRGLHTLRGSSAPGREREGADIRPGVARLAQADDLVQRALDEVGPAGA